MSDPIPVGKCLICEQEGELPFVIRFIHQQPDGSHTPIDGTPSYDTCSKKCAFMAMAVIEKNNFRLVK